MIGQQLRALYMTGTQSPLRMLLDQEGTNTLTRNLQYHDYLVAARRQKMQKYLDAIARLSQLEKETAATISELKNLQTSLEQQNTQLQAERDARKKLAQQADADLQAKGNSLKQLEQDRDALQKVIAEIEKQRAIAQAKEAKLQRDERQKQEAKEQQQAQKKQEEQQAAEQQRVENTPLYSAADLARLQTQSFTQRKGKMPWPVLGKITNQFGAKRQGSITWDGLRIAADSGTAVRAIHGGRVMYADTLRGQGLLLVLDHGDGYMSLYAHNDVLLREVGEWVQPGEVIARVGNSGGEQTPALYFEIRHNGQPINPQAWLSKPH